MFAQKFKRKAFLHKYLEAGMDELEFYEAEGNLSDCCTEYDHNAYY